MGKIVAIGGGDIRQRETLAIDREIFRWMTCQFQAVRMSAIAPARP